MLNLSQTETAIRVNFLSFVIKGLFYLTWQLGTWNNVLWKLAFDALHYYSYYLDLNHDKPNDANSFETLSVIIPHSPQLVFYIILTIYPGIGNFRAFLRSGKKFSYRSCFIPLKVNGAVLFQYQTKNPVAQYFYTIWLQYNTCNFNKPFVILNIKTINTPETEASRHGSVPQLTHPCDWTSSTASSTKQSIKVVIFTR